MSRHNIEVIRKITPAVKGTLTGWHFNSVFFGLLYIWLKDEDRFKQLTNFIKERREALLNESVKLPEVITYLFKDMGKEWILDIMEMDFAFKGQKMRKVNEVLITVLDEFKKLERHEGDVFGPIYQDLI